jgi:hypothetical protein
MIVAASHAATATAAAVAAPECERENVLTSFLRLSARPRSANLLGQYAE